MRTELNQRRQNVLDLIVSAYIRTASPVASQQIAQAQRVMVSPATIRNDMAKLEQLGFITRPHSSSGAIPGDTAYRFHVERISRNSKPPQTVRNLVERTIGPHDKKPELLARTVAEILSYTVGNVAIATGPQSLQIRVKQIQLIHLQDYEALLVIVLPEGRSRQGLLRLPNKLDQNQLSEVAGVLNAQLAGKTLEEINDPSEQLHCGDYVQQIIIKELVGLLELESQSEPNRPYLEGLSNLLGQPEFSKGNQAQHAVEVLEDTRILNHVLSEDYSPGQVRVTIGQEHQYQKLQDFSAVFAVYGVPSKLMGVICIIGPTRMNYVKTVTSVRYMASLLTSLYDSDSEPLTPNYSGNI